jgi:hypothetical protein
MYNIYWNYREKGLADFMNGQNLAVVLFFVSFCSFIFLLNMSPQNVNKLFLFGY